MAHAYVTFRYRLALNALREFAASLKSSAEILILVGTHVLIGLLGLSAFPSMYAASMTPRHAVPLLLLHALAMAIPLALLRQRVLPADVVQWAHRLPLPLAVQLRADAVVAGLLVGPLALLYTVSVGVLLYQRTNWLLPLRGVLGTLLSLALTYAVSIAVLTLRSRGPAAPRFWQRAAHAAAPAYAARRAPLRTLTLWVRLFWSPFWRLDNVVGLQQTLLLAAALASALAWLLLSHGSLRGLLALVSCTLLVVLTDRGDKAVREQAARLRPVLSAWPISTRALHLLARSFSVVPALMVLMVAFAAGLPQDLWSRNAGRAFLTIGCLAPVVLVATPLSNQRARVALVVILIILLTATGSELWP